MTEPLYKDEAIIRAVTFNKGGHRVSLELDPVGWEVLKHMESTRCMMVLVPILNDQTPDLDPQPFMPPGSARRHMSELSRAQQAGILCNDTQFQNWLVRIYEMPVEPDQTINDAAAEFVRRYCKVKSRSMIDGDLGAAKMFDILRSEFDAACGRTARPE